MSCNCECHDETLHMGWGGPDKHCGRCTNTAMQAKPDALVIEELREENAKLRARVKKLEKVREESLKVIPDLDELMERTGDNPYPRCRHCGVTNIQLSMGERTHSCDEFSDLRSALKNCEETDGK